MLRHRALTQIDGTLPRRAIDAPALRESAADIPNKRSADELGVREDTVALWRHRFHANLVERLVHELLAPDADVQARP